MDFQSTQIPAQFAVYKPGGCQYSIAYHSNEIMSHYHRHHVQRSVGVRIFDHRRLTQDPTISRPLLKEKCSCSMSFALLAIKLAAGVSHV